MHKGIKILGKVISAIVLLLIFLPIVLSLLLEINVIQNYVVDKATKYISQKIETTVSIDRVDIGLFSKIKVYGFYVEDYQRDTLLYVGRADAFVTSLGIFDGELQFSRAEVDNAKLFLRETPDSVMNIKQVIDRISNKEKSGEGKFKLKINRATINNLDLRIERLQHRNPDYGVDYGNMRIYDIIAQTDELVIEGSTIYTTIEEMSAKERSGFKINSLRGRFFLNGGGLGFENTSITTPQSSLHLPYLSLVGSAWSDYKYFVDEVIIDAATQNSTVSTDDIAYFAPKMRRWKTTFTSVDATAQGVVSDLAVDVKSLKTGTSTALTAAIAIKGLPDVKRSHFDFDISTLTTATDDIDNIATNIAGKSIPDAALKIIDNTGRLNLTGQFCGMLSDFDATAEIKTLAGAAKCKLNIRPTNKSEQILRGNIEAQDVALGTILGQDKLGRTSFSATVDGTVGVNNTDADIAVNVEKLVFMDYSYDSLRLDGKVKNHKFDGAIASRDHNLVFDFYGSVDLDNGLPRYDFTMDLQRADLTALHINHRDSVSLLSAKIKADAGGRSIDNLNGQIVISDARYHYNADSLQTRRLSIVGKNSDDSKFIQVTSDFADITFRSKTSYKTIAKYLEMSLVNYLPLLYNSRERTRYEQGKTSIADNYSMLSVNIKHINPLTDAIVDGLQIADGSQLQLLFNPVSNKLSFSASSDFIERDRMLATKVRLNASNQGDSLTMYLSSEDMYVGFMHFTDLSVMGGAKNNQLQISTGFNDTVNRFSGLFGAKAEISRNAENRRVMNIRLQPSHITRGDKTWNIAARRIVVDSARIDINNFRIMNDKQQLLINGVASRSRADSITMTLRNFDLTPFTQATEQMGYTLVGTTNGYATVKSALEGSQIRANIYLDSVKVNNIPLPEMLFTSRWDFERSRAGFTVQERAKQDTILRGFYSPSQGRYYARTHMQNIDLSLLDPLLSGVIMSTQGRADANLTLSGANRIAELKGKIEVRNFATTVDYTRARYTIPSAVIDVEDNHLRLKSAQLFDTEKNSGFMSMNLSLSHLSNISYSLDIQPRNMIVLNTTQQDNDLFYGKVYATGSANISGSKRGVKMNIIAATAGNSEFYMPLSSKSNIKSADFVIFESPTQKSDTTNYLVRKKMMFERRSRTVSAGSDMEINMALNVKSNAEVQLVIDPTVGDVIKSRGEGTLNLRINPKSNIFEMFGDYTIVDGSYLFTFQNIFNKKFIIENGSSIHWTGEPVDAILDINALYKLKASLQPLLGTTGSENSRSVPVDCIIHLGDRLSAPTYTFNVKVPNADAEIQTAISNTLNTPETMTRQFAYLLLFHSFYPEATTGTSSSLGVSASTATGFELLSNQLSNWLSTDNYNIVIRYRPKSEMSSDEVDFGFSKSLINNRLFIEAEGNYVIDSKMSTGSNMSNFMGEAYITWLIDRAGSLKLKGFTQTIDRFDENQGLQETGLGVYYKEDFNDFKDLRQRIRERFMSKKRKAQISSEQTAKEPSEKKVLPTADTLKPREHVNTTTPNGRANTK